VLASRFDKLGELVTDQSETDEMGEVSGYLYRAASGFAAAAEGCRAQAWRRVNDEFNVSYGIGFVEVGPAETRGAGQILERVSG
jgi:hypothetical protein